MVLHLDKNNVIIFEFDYLLLVAAFILFQSDNENKIREIEQNQVKMNVIYSWEESFVKVIIGAIKALKIFKDDPGSFKVFCKTGNGMSPASNDATSLLAGL